MSLPSALLGASLVGCGGSARPNGADGTGGRTAPTRTNRPSGVFADDHDGTHAITCGDGTPAAASNGATGGDVAVTSFHGADFLRSSGELAAGGGLRARTPWRAAPRRPAAPPRLRGAAPRATVRTPPACGRPPRSAPARAGAPRLAACLAGDGK